MIKLSIILMVICLCITACKSGNKEPVEEESIETQNMTTAYIGTYTKKEGHVNGQAEGIYTIYLEEETGKLRYGKTVAKLINPSFVKTSRDSRNVYAVSELGPGDAKSGFVYSYKILQDDNLEEIGKISSEGFAPCYLTEDASGQFIFVANYVGGVVVMYRKTENGSLEKLQKITLENPEDSHPHSINITSNNKYVYITDLGNDRIWIYELNQEEQTIQPHNTAYIQLPQGAGPRHFTFSKDQDFAYSINELNSTVSTFKVENTGALSEIQTLSSVPDNFEYENSAADIHLHPGGDYLYVSNRGHNSIAGYKINAETGNLNLLGFTATQGSTPRNFGISPNGTFLFVANQDSNTIVPFKIDLSTGSLEPKGDPLEVKTPVSIEFLQ